MAETDRMRPVVAALPTQNLLGWIGLAPSTLNYWLSRNVVAVTAVPGEGQRFVRYWRPEEAVGVRVVKQLRDTGADLHSAQTAGQVVSAVEDPPAAFLHWDGLEASWRDSARVAPRRGSDISVATLRLVMPVGRWFEEAVKLSVDVDLRQLREHRDRWHAKRGRLSVATQTAEPGPDGD